MEWLFWCFMAFLAFIVVFPRWWDSTDTGRLLNYLEEGRQAGLSVEESLDELTLRHAYVRLRRELSEECVRTMGAIDRAAMQEKIADAAGAVAMVHGKEMGKRFAGWVGPMKTRELLMPAAWDLHVEHCRQEITRPWDGPKMTDVELRDYRNAMKTERGV